jgi:NPCBM/NEW2 domain
MLTAAFLVLPVTCAGAPPSFEVRVHDGKHLLGEIEAVARGRISLTGRATVPGDEWYTIRRSPWVLPPWPDAPHVELTNGDVVRADVVESDGTTIRLRLAVPATPAQTLRFPLSALRVAWLTRRDDRQPTWLAGPRKRDVIQSRAGDVSLGAISAIDTTRNVVRFQTDGRDQQLELTKVAAIGFNTDLARVRRPKGPYYRLTLTDGTRLSVLSLGSDGRSWTAESLYKETVRIPFDYLVAADVEQGKVVSLSDLKPTKYQYQSFDGEDFALATDCCVTGRPMRLKLVNGESTFDRGIGLHAECTVTYRLDEKYRRFEALAGLDARSGARGDCVLVILVDGKERELPGGGRLRLAASPIPVQIDVRAAKELNIAVRRGNGGNVQDHVNLADARLVP